MEWGAAITAAVTLIVALLKWWQSRQPQRDQERRDDEIQQGRRDISNGNAAAVSGRIDSLLTGSGDSTGQSGAAVTAERIRAVAGLADTAGIGSADIGESGSLSAGKG